MTPIAAPSYPDLNPAVMQEAVRHVRARYMASGHSLWDIGNGLCENFADDVLDIVIGENWRHLEGVDGLDWHSLSTECLFAAPDDDGHQVTWDWDLLEHRYGLTVSDRKREACNKIVIESPNHCWIWFQGRHYDCEHPQGKASPFGLNFFRRYLGKTDRAADF